MTETVPGLQEGLKGRFDFTPLAECLGLLGAALENFYLGIRDISEPGDAAERVNETLLQLSHRIVRVTFHDRDCFGFDLAGPMFPIPSLAKTGKLARVTDKSYKHYVLATELQRGLNRVMHHLREALDLLQH